MDTEINLYVYNQQFQMIGVVDKYISLIWSNKYDEPGNFELSVIYDPQLRSLLKQDLFVTTDYTDRFAIIEKIEISKDDDGNANMVISGRSIESILARRIIIDKIEFKDENFQNGIERILNANVIQPSDDKRIIPNFKFEKSTDTKITELTISDETFDKTDVLDAISSLCADKHLGFKILINDKMEYTFSIFKGKDISDKVLFSPYYDNLNNSEYYSSTEQYKNLIYVSKDENSYLTVSNIADIPSGLSRREVHIDSSELKENKSTSLNDDELTKKAKNKLNQEYKNETGFDGDIIPGVTYEYRRDYNAGDKVMLENEFGDSEAVYISEVVITYDETGLSIIPTFEKIDWEWT